MADNKAVLEAANAAVVKGDYEGFLSFCTDDTRWEFVGDTLLEGKEAVRQWMAESYKEPPKLKVEQLIAEGDSVVAIGQVAMKNDGGEEIQYEYCDVWRFRDGKMAALRAFVTEASGEIGEQP